MNLGKPWLLGACVAGALAVGACSSMKTPATADVAVSPAAVESASSADGVEYAPAEMRSARDKLALAKQALATRDYKVATNFANQARADANLARAKADTAKARFVAATLQEDIRVLRLELDRAKTQQ